METLERLYGPIDPDDPYWTEGPPPTPMVGEVIAEALEDPEGAPALPEEHYFEFTEVALKEARNDPDLVRTFLTYASQQPGYLAQALYRRFMNILGDSDREIIDRVVAIFRDPHDPLYELSLPGQPSGGIEDRMTESIRRAGEAQDALQRARDGVMLGTALTADTLNALDKAREEAARLQEEIDALETSVEQRGTREVTGRGQSR